MAVRDDWAPGEVLTSTDLNDTFSAKANIATNAAWTSYTPTLTNLTLGNGTLDAVYLTVGKLVFFRIWFKFGSTSSISGTPTFSLPVPQKTSDIIAGVTALITDAGTTYAIPAAANIGTGITVRAIFAGGTYVGASDMSATVPWTWATNDTISVVGFYEAA